MLIRFRINLRRRKKEKLKRYYRLKQLSYNTLALIYFPIGVILHNTDNNIVKSKPYDKLVKIENKVIKLQKNIAVISLEEKNKEIKKIEAQVILIDKEETDISVKPILNKKLTSIVEKIEFIKNYSKEKVTQKAVAIKKDDIVSHKAVIPNLMSTSTENPTIINTYSQATINTKPIENEVPEIIKKSVEEKFVEEKSEKTGTLNNDIQFIKDKEKEINKLAEQIKMLGIKIASSNQYNDFYEYEKELKEIEIKLKALKKICLEYNYTIELDINTDPYELHKNSKMIDSLIEQVKDNQKKVNSKKDAIFNENEEVKKEVILKDKEKKVEKEETKIDEVLKAQQLVLQNINKQKQLLKDFNKKMLKSKNKKQTLLQYLKDLSFQIFKVMFSFSPFLLFKNKVISSLISAVFVNNSLKTMRKMVDKDYYVSYELIKNNYLNNKDMLLDIYNLCNSSLDEISNIKINILELQRTGSNEQIEQLLKDLSVMEDKINNEKERVKLKGNIIDNEYTKILKKAV